MQKFEYRRFYNGFTAFEKKYAPSNLHIEGHEEFLYDSLKVSVVGSRKPSQLGIDQAECIAKTLVGEGAIVVSGLAEGIDTVAHSSAIKFGGKTLAVLGTSLDKVYPSSNKILLDEIKINHLAVSQFDYGYPIKKENFPMRNRTMALLSDATIIIEASEKSGTRHQGWEALRLGRIVFIMKELIDRNDISWTKEMVKYGAQELTCDVLPEIVYQIPHVTSRMIYA